MKNALLKTIFLAFSFITAFNNLKAQSIFFSENFSSGNFTSSGWTFSPAQGNWQVGGSYLPTGGTTPCAFFNWSPTSTNYSFALVSPVFQAGSAAALTLDYKLQLNNFSTSTLEQFAVEYKTTASGSWSLLENFNNQSGSFNIVRINQFLIGMDGQSFQIRFRIYGVNSFNLNGWGLDDIVVKGTPVAAPSVPLLLSPADLATNVSLNQTLSWSSPFGSDGYKITLGSNAPNFDNVLNDVDLGLINQYQSLLSNSTTYGWKIRAYNAIGNGNYSSLRTFTTVSPGCFNYTYCPTTFAGGVYYEGIQQVIFAGINNTSGTWTNAYTDYRSLSPAQVSVGQTYRLTLLAGNFSANYAYFDWNQDGDFTDGGETFILPSTSGNNSVSADIPIPAGALTGNTAFRIRTSQNSYASPCNTLFDRGEAEDYCIQISAASSCGLPVISSTTAISANSVELLFSGSFNEIQVETAVFDQPQGSGSVTSTNTPTATLTGLTGSTHYRVYYRGRCGATFGAWTGPYFFSPNNTCAGAQPLTAGTATCSPLIVSQPYNSIAVSTNCYTGSGSSFYRFTAGTAPLYIELSGNNSGSTYYVSLLQGTCGSLNGLQCEFVSGSTLMQWYTGLLTPGETYFIAVQSTQQGDGVGFGYTICLREDTRSCNFTVAPDYQEIESCGVNNNTACSTAEIINLGNDSQFVIQGQLATHYSGIDNQDLYILNITNPATYNISFKGGLASYIYIYRLNSAFPCSAGYTFLQDVYANTSCSTGQVNNLAFQPGTYAVYVYSNDAADYPCLATGINTYQLALTATGCSAPLADSIVADTAGVTANLIGAVGATDSFWQIVPGGNSPGVGIVAQGSTNGTSFSAQGLTPGTLYWIYLSSACGAINSSTGGPFPFNTLCSVNATLPLPYNQNFNSLPNATNSGSGTLINGASECWQFNNAAVRTGTSDVMNGPYGVRGITLSTINYDDCRISELIGTLNMSAYAGQTNIAAGFDLGFINNYVFDAEDRVFVRGTNTSPWVELFNWGQYFLNNPSAIQQIITFSNLDLDSTLSANNQTFSSNFQIKFSINNCYYAYVIGGYEGISIDNLIITTCPSPTGVNISSITSSGALVQWTGNGSSSYDLYYSSDPGVIPDQSTSPTNAGISGNSITLNSLNPGTGYNIFLRGNCGNGESSQWAGPFQIITQCNILSAASLPILEPFDLIDDVTFTQPGDIYCQPTSKWSFENPTGEGGAFAGANAYNGLISSDAITLASFTNSGNYTDNNLIWTINLSNYVGNSDILLSFDYEALGDEADLFDRVYLRGSSSDTWIEAFDWTPIYSGFDQALIDVDSVLSSNSQSFSSSFQVRWRQYDNFGPGTDGLSIDNVSLFQSACGTEPSNLSASVTGYNSAILSWTPTGSEALWDIYLAEPAGVDPIAGTTPTYNDVNTSSYSITGLSGNASFKYFVRAQCGSGITSFWAGPYYFTTNDSCQYAIPITQTAIESYQYFDERDAGPDGGLCSGSITTLDKEVWFRFTPTTSLVEIDIFSSAFYPISYEVLSGTCGSLNSVCCVTSPSSTNTVSHVLSGLSIGTTYYIHLGIDPLFTNANIGVSVSNVTAFSACSFETSTPDFLEAEACEQSNNNSCGSGQALALTTGVNYVHGASTNNCSANDEDWYLFTVTSTSLYQFSTLAQFPANLAVLQLNTGCTNPLQLTSSTQLTPCAANSFSLNLTPGNYAVRITNVANFSQRRHACGVRDKYELKITVNCSGILASINASPSQTICANEAPVTLSASPTGAASYSWNNGSTASNITVNTSGIYSVTITDAQGCTGTSFISVTINSNPFVTAGSNSPQCEGNTINLNASFGTSYNWTGPNGFSSTIQNPVLSNAALSTGGTYTVEVTNAAGCTAAASTSVLINPDPLDLGEIQPLIIPAGAYAYHPFDGNASDLSGNNRNGTNNGATTTANRFGLSGAALSISPGNNVAFNVTGGQTGAFSVSFWFKTSQISTGSGQWVNGIPLVDAEQCGVVSDWGTSMLSSGRVAFGLGAGDITVVSTSTGNNNNAWHHVVAQRDASGLMQLYVDNILQGTASGPFTPRTSAVFAGANSCAGSTYSGSMDEVIFFNRTLSTTEISGIYSSNLNALGLSYTGSGVCSGGSFSASLLNSQPGASYQLINAGTFNPIGSSVTGNGSTISLSTPALTADVNLAIRSTIGSCSRILDTIIPVVITPSSINVSINPSGSTTFCAGGSVVLSASGTGITSYQWNTGATTASIATTSSGNYSVLVQDAGGCSESVSLPVTVNPNPVISFTSGSNPFFCPGGSVTTTARPNGSGYNLTWYDSNTDSTRTFNTAGSYSVTITNSNGCSGSASVQVNQASVPTISATNNGPLCGGYTLTLSGAGSGFNLANWTGPNGFNASGANTSRNAVTGNDAGYYIITVSNASGCTAMDSTLAEINGNAPVISYSGNVNFTNQLVYPLVDNPYESFRFEATYTDADGNLPFPGYPKVLMDYEPNGSYFNTNDRLFAMIESDPTDLNVTDGKQYYYNTTGLPTGSGWATTIRALDSELCQTDFGPSASPDVLDDADISIFANDIWFSNNNPDTLESITVFASIQNPSDFPAENFFVHLVNQFDSLAVYPDQFVSYLAPHSSVTVQWTIVTPSVPSWNPMQVFIDFTNVIPEPNELDNQAIRPFINGAYNLPGGISLNPGVSPYISTAVVGNTVAVFGNANYFGTPIPLADPSVAGATVNFTLLETGASYSSYTNNSGNFYLTMPTPLSIGTYHVAISVTDFTLTGYDTIAFELIPPVCLPDLSILLTLDSTYFWYNGSTAGTVKVTNNGCQNLTNSTTVQFTATNGAPVPASFTVPPLAIGASYIYTIPLITLPGPGTFTFSASADFGNLVIEQSEGNNTDYATATVVVPGINLLTNYTNISLFNYLECQNQLFTFNVLNGGLLAAGAYDVKLTVSYGGTPVLTQTQGSTGLNAGASESFFFPFSFVGTGSYQLSFEVDIPTGSGLVTETNENDNTFNRTIQVVICEPELQVNGCQSLFTTPQNPGFPGSFTANATITNSGSASAIAPFNVDFNVNGTSNLLTISNDLAPGQSLAVTKSINVPSPGSNELIVQVDAGNAVSESTESNNEQSVALCYEFYPSAYCYGVGWWNFTQVVNQPVAINCGVNNQGIYTAPSVQTLFELSGPGIAGWLNLGLANNGNLNTRCFCPSSAALALPYLFTQAGTYQLRVTMDPNNVFVECDETNNQLILPIEVTDLPDYRILSQYIAPSLLNPQPGEAITVDVSYENVGFSDVGSTLELYTRVNTDPLDSTQVIGLATNDFVTYAFGTAWSSNLPGTHVIRAIIDHDNEVMESVEIFNNEATRAIIVGDAVNFEIPSFTVSNPSPALGSSVVFSITVKNSGDVNGNASLVLTYVDDNSDTIPFATLGLNLNAGDSVLLSVPWGVLDNLTTIVASVVNSVPQEATYTDNNETLQIGGLTLSVTTINESCAGSANGLAIAQVSGGTAPYVYFWSNGSTNDTLVGSAGTYTLTVFDINGFSAVTNATIVLTPDVNPPQISGIPGTIFYTATAGDCPSVISWTPPTATDNCGVNLFVSNYSPGDAFTPGTTIVTYTATDGFGNNTQASFSIIVTAGPEVVAGDDQITCASAVMAADPMPFGVGTWALVSGAGTISNVNDPAAIISDLAGGQNIFTWTFSNGTCPNITDTIIITDTCSCPIIASSAIISGTCENLSEGSIDLSVTTGTAPYTFIWNGSNPANEDLATIASGTYTVTITDANGCSGTNSFQVPQYPAIASADILVSDALCGNNNGSFLLNMVNGGTPPYAFGFVSGFEVSDSLLSNLVAGGYNVYVRDINGCSYDAGNLVIAPVDSIISFTATASAATCGNNNGIIEVNNISGGVAPYSILLGDLASGIPQATPIINGLSPGSYDITIADANGCHLTQNLISVADLAGPTSATLIISEEGCSNSGGVAVGVVVGGTAPFEYSLDGLIYQSSDSFTNLSAGNYSIYIKDVNQCVYDLSFSINNTANLITNLDISLLNAPCSANDGSFNITSVTGGDPDYQFSLDGITYQSTSTFLNLSAGTYSVYVKDINGCSYIEGFNLPTASGITNLDFIVTAAGCGTSDGSIVVTNVSGGTPPYTYQLNSGTPGPSNSFSALAGGLYNLTVYDNSGCSFTQSVNVEGLIAITDVAISTQQASCGNNDGIIRLLGVTGGTAPYELSLDGVNFTPADSIAGLPGSAYTLYLRDATGCLYTEAFVINQNSAVVLSLNGTNPSCANSNGSIDLIVSGGASPYTFLWNTGTTNEDLSGLDGNTEYLVTVTDALGCIAKDSILLSNSPALLLASSVTDAGCGINNGSITLSVISGTGPFTYTWSNGASSEDIVSLVAGNYDVIVSDANGCMAYDSIQVNSTLPPVLSFIANNVVCSNATGSVDMSITGGLAPYTILWSDGSSLEDISGLSAGIYSVTVTDANACSTASSASISDQPAATLIGGQTNETCSAANASVDLVVSGGTAPFAFLWSNGETTEDLSGVSAGTYSVDVTDNNGCISNWFVVVTDIPAPTATAISVDETCSSVNGSVNLSITGGAPPFNILWNNGASTEDIVGLGAGSYNVSILDQNGCVATASANISNQSGPSISSNVADATCGLPNGSISLTISGGSAPYDFLWSNGATNEDISSLAASTYSVIVGDASGCLAYDTITLITTTPPVLSFAVGNETCGSNNGAIDMSITGGLAPYTILWSNGASTEDITSLASGAYSVAVIDGSGCLSTGGSAIANEPPAALSFVSTSENCGQSNGEIDMSISGGTGPFSFVWSNGAATEDLSSIAAGTYTVIVIDLNGCLSSGSVSVASIAGPALTSSLTQETCSGSNGSINLSIVSGTTPYTILWNTGATNEDISGLTAGNYSVSVTDAAGCLASLNETITNAAGPVVSETHSNETCSASNGSIDLTISGGTAPINTLWNNGAITEDLIGLSAASYTVTVTDANGCLAATTATITNAAAAILTSVQNDETCTANNGSIDLTIVGGTAPFAINWSNGSALEDINGLSAGSYTVIVTDANACISSTTVSINNLAAPVLSSTEINETCSAANGSIDLQVSGGTAPFLFLWNTGATIEDLTAIAAGNYSVDATDNNGCTSTWSVVIIDASAPVAVLAPVDETCSAVNGSIDLTISGGASPISILWNTGATTEDLIGLGAGNYSVTLNDLNGCVTTASTSIINQSAPVLTSTSTDETCTNGNGSIDLSIGGGTGPFTILWSNASTSEDLTGLAAGTFIVDVTDNNGCLSNASINIVNQAEPILSAITADEVCNSINGSVDLLVSGGAAPFNYLWTNGSTTEDLSGLSAGTYTIGVSDGNGCFVNASYTISNLAGPALSHIILNETCSGANGSIDLSITSGTGPFVISWSNAATTEDLSSLDAGTYDVIVQDQNGCIAYDTILVNNESAAVLNGISTPETCNSLNGAIALSLTGGTAPFTYLWSNGETTEDISGLLQGTYLVDVSDANGCTSSASYTVADQGSPVIIALVSDETCTAANGSIDLTSTGINGALTFTWSNGSNTEDINALSAGTYDVLVTDAIGCSTADTLIVGNQSGPSSYSIVTINATCNAANGAAEINSIVDGTAPFSYAFDGVTLQAIDSIVGIQQGTYTALVSDANGCTLSQTYTINQDPLPIAFAGNDTSICLSGQASLSASGGITYSWNNGVGVGQSVVVSPFSTTLYTVTATDANGCSSQDSVLVNILPLPAQPVINSTSGFSFCSGTSLTLYSSYTGGNLWSTGAASDSIFISTGGQIILTYTDANGCANSDSVNLTVNPLPAVSLVGTPDHCENAGIMTLSNGAPSGGSYTGTGITGTAFDPSGIPPGTVTVTYTYTDGNGCINSASDNFELFAKPILSVLEDPLNFCLENDPTEVVNISPGGGKYYGQGFLSDSLTFDPSSLSEGLYTAGYLYTDGNGCVNFTEFSNQVGRISISIPDNFSGINNQPFIVATQLNYYNTQANLSYEWEPANLFTDPNSATPYVSVKDSAIVYVTVKDDYCTATASAKVLAVEDQVTIVVATNSPGSGEYEFIIDNGKAPTTAVLEIYNEIGMIIRTTELNIASGRTRHPVNISEQPNGAYFSRIFMGKLEKKHQLIKVTTR